MTDRGAYRGMYSVLLDDEDYQRLSASARLVLLTARLCRDAGPSGIYLYSRDTLVRQTGLTARQVTSALAELARGHWAYTEGPVLWVRNALRYDPWVRLCDAKHKAGILRHLSTLPRVPLVLKFCDYYHLPHPFPNPSEGSHQPFDGFDPSLVSREKGVGSREKGVGIETSPPSPSPPEGAAAASNGQASWGTVEALVALYNASTPDELPALKVLSPKRREKARRYLKQFPEREFWETVFSQMHRSRFLRGLTEKRPGHASWVADLDWLLTAGRDGTENVVKVHDGKYA